MSQKTFDYRQYWIRWYFSAIRQPAIIRIHHHPDLHWNEKVGFFLISLVYSHQNYQCSHNDYIGSHQDYLGNPPSLPSVAMMTTEVVQMTTFAGDYQCRHVTTQVVPGCTWVTTPDLVKTTTFSFQFMSPYDITKSQWVQTEINP